MSIGRENAHQVVLLEIPLDAGHANGQDAHGLVAAHRLHRLGVQVNLSFGEPRAMRNPLLHARHAALSRSKARTHHAAGPQHQVGQHVLAPPVGNDYLDALVGHLAGHATLGHHAAAPEARLFRADILLQVPVRLHLADNLRARRARRTVIDAVHVAQDDQCLHVHHRGDKPGKFVVVREHQLRDADRVVLVHDGNHPVFEHHHHAVALVQVVAARPEVLLHGKHLSHGQMVLAEQLIVAVDKLGLPHG